MKVAIRPANLESDRKLLIDTLQRFLTPKSDARRFRWLYENNPGGQVRSWIAQLDEKVIGMASAFPRRIHINGQEASAWVLGDFCIDDRYRTLGPALQLQKTCLAAAEASGIAFCYDFPSSVMMAVYKRLGISASHQMLRLARPLRVDRKINAIIGNPVLAQALSFLGNLVLSVGTRADNVHHGLSVASHQGPCGEEFSLLAQHMTQRQEVGAVRLAEYLNWRYLENPLYKYEILTARRGSRLVGCAVFQQEKEDAMLVDLFGSDDETVVGELIGHGVAAMARRGVHTLNVALVEGHPWHPLLDRYGFRTREASPMVVHFPPGTGCYGENMKRMNFLFMYGDRDS